MEKGGIGLVRCHDLQHNDTQYNNIQNCQTQHNYKKNVTLSIYRQYADSHIFEGKIFLRVLLIIEGATEKVSQLKTRLKTGKHDNYHFNRT